MAHPPETIEGARRYEVTRTIARGGTAEVLEAVVVGERAFARRVAIKRLLPDADDDFLASFTDEARILSQLQHANIVPLFDFGVADGRPFLVLELVDGLDLMSLETLAASLGKRIPEGLALFAATEVAHALAYAHEATDAAGNSLGIVHRDVTPRNILVSFNGEVRLTDFGIARAKEREALTRVGHLKGTSEYMSPEQRQGGPIDGRSDIFSLGCVLHRVLTRRSPLEGLAPEAPITRIDLDESLPDDIARIIDRATQLRKPARYNSASEFASDTWKAMSKRLEDDARVSMRAFLSEFKSSRDPSRPSAQPRDEISKSPSGKKQKPKFAQFEAPLMDTGPAAATPVRARPKTKAAQSVEFAATDEDTDQELEALPNRERATNTFPPPTRSEGHDEATVLRDPSRRSEPAPQPSENPNAEPTQLNTAALAQPKTTQRGAARTGDGTRPTIYDPTQRIRDRAPKDDPLIGSVLHGYRLVEPLGKGSYARVYRAAHEILDFQCAVKILTEPSESAAKRLLREARFLSSVEHENLIRLYDCGTTEDGRPWLSMELLEGQTLADVIKSQAPLPLGRVEQITRQIASGLASAHERGLVHRDLKPANVMLVDHHGVEWVKILDFGVARALVPEDAEALTRVNQVVGTPVYMAPEQVMRSSSVGPAADLYALGIILYEMVAGIPPFRGGGAAKVMEAQLRSPPPPIPPCHGLEILIEDLLKKDPEKRPRSGSEIIERLDLLFSDAGNEWKGETITVGGEALHPESVAPTEAPPIVSSSQDRLKQVVVVMLGALVVLTGIVLYALLARPPEVPLAEAVSVPEPPPPEPVLPKPPPPPPPPPQEVQPVQEAPKEVEKVVERKEKPRSEPKSEPKPKTEVDTTALRTTFEQRVARTGLSAKDLSAFPELSGKLEELERALTEGDAARAQATADGIVESLRTLPIPDAILEKRLKRCFEELGKRSGLPMEVYDPLEAQYFELRQALKAGMGPSESRDLLRKISDLERKLKAAGS